MKHKSETLFMDTTPFLTRKVNIEDERLRILDMFWTTFTNPNGYLITNLVINSRSDRNLRLWQCPNRVTKDRKVNSQIESSKFRRIKNTNCCTEWHTVGLFVEIAFYCSYKKKRERNTTTTAQQTLSTKKFGECLEFHLTIWDHALHIVSPR